MSQLTENRRRPQTCALCSNHGENIPKKGHKHCPRENDHNCKPCNDTKERRDAYREEIKRKRRHDAVNPNTKKDPSKQRQTQECRKCRNHGDELPISGGHKAKCPYANCSCTLCRQIDLLRMSTKNENNYRRCRKEPKLSLDSGYESFASNSPESNFYSSQNDLNEIDEPGDFLEPEQDIESCESLPELHYVEIEQFFAGEFGEESSRLNCEYDRHELVLAPEPAQDLFSTDIGILFRSCMISNSYDT